MATCSQAVDRNLVVQMVGDQYASCIDFVEPFAVLIEWSGSGQLGYRFGLSRLGIGSSDDFDSVLEIG